MDPSPKNKKKIPRKKIKKKSVEPEDFSKTAVIPELQQSTFVPTLGNTPKGDFHKTQIVPELCLDSLTGSDSDHAAEDSMEQTVVERPKFSRNKNKRVSKRERKNKTNEVWKDFSLAFIVVVVLIAFYFAGKMLRLF